jgi:hypothetical protein
MKKTTFYICLALLSVLVTDPYGTITENVLGGELTKELSSKEKEKDVEESKELELEEDKEESLASKKAFNIKTQSEVPTQTLYTYTKSIQSPFVASEHECLHKLHQSFLC